MTSKQSALLADLAKLLTTYSARDWQPVIKLLTADKEKLAEVVAALSDKARVSKPKARKNASTAKRLKSVRKARLPNKAARSVAKRAKKPVMARKALAPRRARAPVSKKLNYGIVDAKPRVVNSTLESDRRGALIYGLVRTPLSSLQLLYARVLGKKEVPVEKDEVISQLLQYADGLTPAAHTDFMAALDRLSEGPTENYRRWADIISRPR